MDTAMPKAFASHRRVPGDPPHPVDQHVGARLRARRRQLRISQASLAKALGLTAQQVQKYERGANRISASMLHGMAQALDRPVGWFFEGLGEAPSSPPDDQMPSLRDVQRFLGASGGARLALAYGRLSLRAQHQVLNLAETLAQDDEPAASETKPERAAAP
jgi:transcriptional regulator with XRE-family HTH domain